MRPCGRTSTHMPFNLRKNWSYFQRNDVLALMLNRQVVRGWSGEVAVWWPLTLPVSSRTLSFPARAFTRTETRKVYHILRQNSRWECLLGCICAFHPCRPGIGKQPKQLVKNVKGNAG